MLYNSNEDSRPEIVYPCTWEYKVIGSDIEKILYAIDSASHGLEYSVVPSNVSRNEKYFSINFRIEVPNEVTRDIIYEALIRNEFVKIVL